MKRRLMSFVLAITTLCVAFLTSCGNSGSNSSAPGSAAPSGSAASTPAASGSGKKITIGYDIYYVGNTWSVQLYKEFQSAVKRYQDQIANVIYVESEGKVDKQIANIEDLITRKVDVIITTPNSSTALVPVLKKAQQAGIKVVLLGATIQGSGYDSLVTVKDYDFGKTGAEWLAKKLNGEGKIVMLNGIAGISASEDRTKGAMDVLKQYPNIKVVASSNADWDYAKAKVAMGDILTAQPQIDGVWSQGGAMTLGAIEAFQAAGRKLVPMTGEDNNGFLKKWNELKSQGFSSVACSKPTWLSEEALKAAIKLGNGQSVTKDDYVSVPVITDSTLSQYVKPNMSDSFYANTKMSEAEIKAAFSN